MPPQENRFRDELVRRMRSSSSEEVEDCGDDLPPTAGEEEDGA